VGVVALVGVNPAYTSQDRSHCGHRHALSRSDRRYTCPCRGAVLDRDLTASLNMLSVGRHTPAPAEKFPLVSGSVVTGSGSRPPCGP
jgi:transposase